MKKKFSIGSKKENAKQIDINLKPKHIKFAAVIFIIALLVHMFVWSPYIEKEYKIECSDGNIIKIEDGLTHACGIIIPPNMQAEEIKEYLLIQIEKKK